MGLGPVVMSVKHFSVPVNPIWNICTWKEGGGGGGKEAEQVRLTNIFHGAVDGHGRGEADRKISRFNHGTRWATEPQKW